MRTADSADVRPLLLVQAVLLMTDPVRGVALHACGHLVEVLDACQDAKGDTQFLVRYNEHFLATCGPEAFARDDEETAFAVSPVFPLPGWIRSCPTELMTEEEVEATWPRIRPETERDSHPIRTRVLEAA